MHLLCLDLERRRLCLWWVYWRVWKVRKDIKVQSGQRYLGNSEFCTQQRHRELLCFITEPKWGDNIGRKHQFRAHSFSYHHKLLDPKRNFPQTSQITKNASQMLCSRRTYLHFWRLWKRRSLNLRYCKKLIWSHRDEAFWAVYTWNPLKFNYVVKKSYGWILKGNPNSRGVVWRWWPDSHIWHHWRTFHFWSQRINTVF